MSKGYGIKFRWDVDDLDTSNKRFADAVVGTKKEVEFLKARIRNVVKPTVKKGHTYTLKTRIIN